MTPDPYSDLERIIDNYDRVIKEVRENLGDLGPYSRTTPATPIYHKYQAKYLSDHLDLDDESNLAKEVARIKTTTSEFVELSNKEFFRSVMTELDVLVEDYPLGVANAFELHPISIAVDEVLYQRDHIEMILTFFSDMANPPLDQVDKKVREHRIRMTALDRVLRREFAIHDTLVSEHQDELSREHYPDHYWWRHPEDISRYGDEKV